MSGQAKPFTVSELTRHIKALIERGFPSVALTGELSNVHRHSSGHIYFTLKDENAQISAVIWRSKASLLRLEPVDGLQVVVSGRLTVYEVRGSYQIEISSMRPVGFGELAVMFEQLKRKLDDEGLFDAGRKRPIPFLPQSIGIVTSPTGAVLQDMISIMNRRFPGIQLILCPVHVQGGRAASEIASAIQRFNEEEQVDVIILARGGGSLEDIWPFNEERVARQISSSKIPIVSAIGHETDYTIADFVADLRAPTPSAAAELVVPDRHILLGNLHKNWYNLHESTKNMLKRHRDTIQSLTRSHPFHYPLTLLNQASQRIDELERSLQSSVDHRITLLKSSLSGFHKRVLSLDPESTLKRGYTLIYEGRKIIKGAAELESGNQVDIRFHDGIVRSTVE